MKCGLFITPAKSHCSIYESGAMISSILITSNKYNLDILNIPREGVLSEEYTIPENYDFYVFNWHHWALPIARNRIIALPGKKLSILLEISPTDVFAYSHSDWFDAYMAIDPTKNRFKNVYPFPRPIEKVNNLRPLINDKIPVLGSFGFLTAGKRFDEIIKNANNMGSCMVRINIPPASWNGETPGCTRLKEHADGLRRIAKSNIDLRLTEDYMTQQELVKWCSENTINIFPYYRKQPGLAAVTDQAISAGRGIAVNSCDTFRHLHKYISYYPKQSYLELAISTLQGVKQMQEDWKAQNFLLAFEKMLIEEKII